MNIQKPSTDEHMRFTIISGIIIIILLTLVVIFAKPEQKKTEKPKYKIYNYYVAKNANGIISFYTDSDSLANVTYIYNKDTIIVNQLFKEEFDSLVKLLYPQTNN